MNFRSIDDMCHVLARNLYKVPRDVDLIVGIPRSGLLAANTLALYLNLPFTDLEGFLAGRVLSTGRTRNHNPEIKAIKEYKKVLVIDDSLRTGNTLAKAKAMISAASLSQKVLFSAVFVAPEVRDEVDIYFEVCKLPRVFEWNIMHHEWLASSCIDIDGVLCKDPTTEENDDGPNYIQFLEAAPPLFLPSLPVGYLVTNRLEKYRRHTEEWLAKHRVFYKELIMLDLPSKAARLKSKSRAIHKAKAYRETKSKLFLESDYNQANEIFNLTGKPVVCIERMELISSGEPLYSLPVKRSIKYYLIKSYLRFVS